MYALIIIPTQLKLLWVDGWVVADLEKTGILGSWILRNIFQNDQIEEHFEQSPAYLDFNACKLNFRMQIILNCSLFALWNTFLLIIFNILTKLCEEN